MRKNHTKSQKDVLEVTSAEGREPLISTEPGTSLHVGFNSATHTSPWVDSFLFRSTAFSSHNTHVLFLLVISSCYCILEHLVIAQRLYCL